MSKFKVALTLVTVLAVAGCAGNREPGTVRNGPQVESPHADAPGGKMPEGGNATSVVIVDDTQAQIDQFAAGAATSIVQTVFR